VKPLLDGGCFGSNDAPRAKTARDRSSALNPDPYCSRRCYNRIGRRALPGPERGIAQKVLAALNTRNEFMPDNTFGRPFRKSILAEFSKWPYTKR